MDSSRPSLILFIALALPGGVGCSDAVVEHKADKTRQEVINGAAVTGLRGQVVQVTSPAGNCTGTLVRDNIVLTAKHCLHPNGFVDQTSGFLAGNQFIVFPQGGGTGVQSTTWVALLNRETALIILSAPIPLDPTEGTNFGQFTPIWWGTDNAIFSSNVLCAGYGFISRNQAQCQSGGGTAAFRMMTNTPAAVPGDATRLRYTENASNQNWANGDSGASGFISGGSVTATDIVTGPLGYNAGTGTCYQFGDATNWGMAWEDAVAPTAYRNWAHDEITNNSPNVYDDLLTNTLASYPEFHDSGVSPAPSWSWNSAGHWRQPQNSYRWIGGTGGYLDGTRRINRDFVVGDGYVNARFRSTSSDNDVAAVILHYRDDDTYYRFSVDPERDRARIEKRRPGVSYQVLSEVSVNAIMTDWGDLHWLSLGSVGNTLYAYIDFVALPGLTVTDTDGGGMSSGYAGIELAGLAGARVYDFGITHW